MKDFGSYEVCPPKPKVSVGRERGRILAFVRVFLYLEEEYGNLNEEK